MEIFDSINFLFDATAYQHDPNNVRAPAINGSENLEASFDFGTENGMVSVVLNSMQECTITVTSPNSTFDIVTKGLDTVISDGSPANIDIDFKNQTLAFFASPPSPPMDLFVLCEGKLIKAKLQAILT